MTRIPDDIRQKLLTMYYKGTDALTIAKSIGVCLTTVYRVVNNLEKILVASDPPICSHFGCGHRLTPDEQLYGDRCIDHQEVIKLTHVINQFL